MSAKPLLLFGAGIIIAGAFGLTWHDHAEAVAVEKAIQAASAREAQLTADGRRIAATLAAGQQERDTRRIELEALHATKTAKPRPPVTNKAAAGPPGPMDLLQNDPKLQVQFLQAQRVRLARAYGPFFRTAGLSADDARKVTDLLLRRFEQNTDLDAVARERGLPRDAPEIVALRRTAAADFEQNAQDVLGAAGFAQLKDYERAAPTREMVERFVGAAVVNNVPLTWAQTEQFTRVLSEAAPNFQAGGRADPMTINWAAADARAAEVLTPQQLALFQHIEPIGGGASRWISQFEQALSAARKSTSREVGAALDTLGKKGPGG